MREIFKSGSLGGVGGNPGSHLERRPGGALAFLVMLISKGPA